jgi:cell division initiation protein
MNITPNEISNKDFKKVFRGYDMDEVDEFLDQLVEDYDKLFKENINLKDSVTALEDKIVHYSNIESTLQNTLLLAQTTADQVKENSKREIDILLRDANDNAGNIVKKAEDRILDINKDYEKIKQDYLTFKTRFKALLEAQVESLEKTDIEVRDKF